MSVIRNVWCVVCGLDFEPIEVHDSDEVNWDEPDPDVTPWWSGSFLDSKMVSKKQVEWMGDMNVIGPKGKYPFFIEEDSPVYPAVKQTHTHRHEPTAKVSDYPNPDGPDGNWELFLDLFPIHRACTEILKKTLSRRQEQFYDQNVPTTLMQVYEILNTENDKDHSPFTMGISRHHGYYGVEQFWDDGFGMEWDDGFEYLCVNPLEVTGSLTNALFKLLQPLQREETRKSLPVSQDLPIIRLAPELLYEITAYLSTSSILSLHRTCRDMAHKIPLAQCFWREQLISGKLVPYIWPEDVDVALCLDHDVKLGATTKDIRIWDWKALCMLLMKKHYVPGKDEKDNDEARLEALPLGFRNRRRICAITQAIVDDIDVAFK